jgi:hypothetical protein
LKGIAGSRHTLESGYCLVHAPAVLLEVMVPARSQILLSTIEPVRTTKLSFANSGRAEDASMQLSQNASIPETFRADRVPDSLA